MEGSLRTSLNIAVFDIVEEHDKAVSRYPAFNSPHEGLAIIQEKFEELKTEVFLNHSKRDKAKMRREAVQIGAMALRFIIDCTE